MTILSEPAESGQFLLQRRPPRSLPALTTFDDLVGRASEYIGALVNPEGRPSWEAGPLVTDWQTVTGHVAEIRAEFNALAGYLQRQLLEQGRTADYTNQQVRAIVDRSNAAMLSAARQATDAAEAMLAHARAAALPARPAPQDAAQEARLAGLKSDLQLATSRVTDEKGLVDALTGRLAAAVSTGDSLGVWLLTSDWPSAILAPALGLELIDAVFVPMWDATTSELLAGADASTRDRLRIYRGLQDTRRGLPVLLAACGSFLNTVIDDVIGYVQGNPTGNA